MKDKKTPDDKIQFSMPLNRRSLKYIAATVILIALAYIAVDDPKKISNFISSAISLLSPFLIGFCMAYVVNLLLRPLEGFWQFIWKKLKNKKLVTKLKRPICLTLSFLIVLGAFFALAFMVVPALKDTVISFADKVPQYAKTLEQWYGSTVDFFARYNFELPEITLDITKVTGLITNVMGSYGENMLNTTFNFTASIASAVLNLILGIVFSIYVLAQKEKLGRQANKIIYALFRKEKAEKIIDFAVLTDDIFTKFVTGQLTEACIIGILCFIGMLIFGMPYAGIISVLIGFTALIPMFGAFIGTGIGAFLILLESPIKALWFVVFIIVLQQLEGNLIYPRVVGKSVGLPGIWVLTAVTVGGGMFGIIGMLFSVPVCSVLYVIFRKYVNKKTAKVDLLPKETDEDETE